MARPKANATRGLLKKQTEAFDVEFSSVDAEGAFGVNRGFINRLVKDGIVTPCIAGEGAGISRRFSLWNMIEISLAGELDGYLKYFTTTRIVQQVASWFRMNFFQYVPLDEVYKYLLLMEGKRRQPFQTQTNEAWQSHPAIFMVKLNEGGDENIHPVVTLFSVGSMGPLGIRDQFDNGVTHVINMHAIAARATARLILYDESRKNE